MSAQELDLDTIRARAEAATQGPWKAAGGYVETCPEFDPHRFDTMGMTVAGCAEDVDAEFMAHARTDVPALVAEVERLRGDVRELVDEGIRQKRRANGDAA